MKINDIPPEGLSLELNQTIDLFDTGAAATPVTAVLNIKPIGVGVFHIAGRVRSELTLECSRCLKWYQHHVDTVMNIDLAPLTTMGAAPEHEVNRSELDTEFYQGDEISPSDLVKEQLLIMVPMVPLHDQQCKGLCPNCGIDMNLSSCNCTEKNRGEFGPFAALKDLMNK